MSLIPHRFDVVVQSDDVVGISDKTKDCPIVLRISDRASAHPIVAHISTTIKGTKKAPSHDARTPGRAQKKEGALPSFRYASTKS